MSGDPLGMFQVRYEEVRKVKLLKLKVDVQSKYVADNDNYPAPPPRICRVVSGSQQQNNKQNKYQNTMTGAPFIYVKKGQRDLSNGYLTTSKSRIQRP